MFEFKFPDVAEGIHEGKLVNWKVKEEDSIEHDQVLCEMETDKTVLEIPSPVKGKVSKLHFKAGDVVQVGETLISFDEVEGDIPKQPNAEKAEIKKELTEIKEKKEAIKHNILILPKDRKLAEDYGIDITRIKGTGPRGRITTTDVQKAKDMGLSTTEAPTAEKEESSDLPSIQRKSSPSQRRMARELGVPVEQLLGSSTPAPAGSSKPDIKPLNIEGERIRIDGIRETIRKQMETAWRIPQASVETEFNANKLIQHRNEAKIKLKEKGIKLTYLAYIVKVCADALENFPYFNACYDEAKNELILKKNVSIGIAVDTDYGLIVPSIKECDKKTIAQIAKEIQDLAEKARNKKLSPTEIESGVFSITNVGSMGGTSGDTIINHPATAILLVGTFRDQLDMEGERFVNKKMMPLKLTFDHRIIDGGDAARFMNFMKELLVDPQMKVE